MSVPRILFILSFIYWPLPELIEGEQVPSSIYVAYYSFAVKTIFISCVHPICPEVPHRSAIDPLFILILKYVEIYQQAYR